ncbi:itaconate CoA-transferase [Rhodoligotrophos appendicifer]|uniref:CaiB/BaiF CoA transferase family protein n=1 Tax=Rhodoligotrophos appendicifer TaxID=987056 RepID=UPI001184CE55|nr:CaiB/BaiF CoA-transferase family protein [Rhodoligotrophos appendicifer]
MSRPLDGILVVSLEQAIAAPYCSRQLADLGARVIKVERPDGGDFARAYDTRVHGLSSHFVWTNRSKESLAIDVKQPRAIAALRTLIDRADIFIQNLAPGAANRLGLGSGDLRAENSRLITCSISGYGPDGPWENRKAYDLLVQAEGGFLSVTGTPEQMAKAGISIADIAAGTMALQGILGALLHRERTGRGDHIEVSMLEAMAEWMGFPLNYSLDGAPPPPRAGAGHATIFPYGPYQTSDGAVLFGLQNDREWASFAHIVLERHDWAEDERFRGNSGRVSHRDEIDTVIRSVFEGLSTSTAIARLDQAGIGTARVNDMAALWAHPQLKARDRWGCVETPGGSIQALKPISGDSWTPRLDAVPALGQHSEKILQEIGVSPADIQALTAGPS